MSLVAADMTVTAADVEREFVEVLESGGRLLGFYRLQRRLFERACDIAREWGYEPVEASLTKPSTTTLLPDDAGSLVPVSSTEMRWMVPGARSTT